MCSIRKILVPALVFGFIVPVFAGPLAPSLNVTPVAGETTLLSANTPGVSVAYVDWMVLSEGDYSSSALKPLVNQAFGSCYIPQGKYFYAYQVESLIDEAEVFTVNIKDSSLVDAVGTSCLDLDSVGHSAAYFPNLGGSPAENEFSSQQPLVDVTSEKLKSTCITWRFDGELDAGEESEALWFISSCSPSYRPVAFQDSVPPSPGVGDIPSNQVPAPGALLLGITGLGMINRVRRVFI
jgi:hypothetical protein